MFRGLKHGVLQTVTDRSVYEGEEYLYRGMCRVALTCSCCRGLTRGVCTGETEGVGIARKGDSLKRVRRGVLYGAGNETLPE